MDKILIFIFALLLCGCADYSTRARVDGIGSPNDLVPQPFPDPPTNTPAGTHN